MLCTNISMGPGMLVLQVIVTVSPTAAVYIPRPKVTGGGGGGGGGGGENTHHMTTKSSCERGQQNDKLVTATAVTIRTRDISRKNMYYRAVML